MAHFEHSYIIPAPREKVFAFQADLNLLLKTLPESYKAQLVGGGEKLDRGVEFEVRASRFGLSVLWTGIIEDYQDGEFYVDRQINGPFSLWVHTHRYEDHASGTLVTEHVEYDIPFGLLGKLADDLLVRAELKRFFEVRAEKTKQALS